MWVVNRAEALQRDSREHRGRLAAVDVRFYESRRARIGTALGRGRKRAIQFMKNPASGDDCFWHTRDMPINSSHADLNRGLRPRGGRYPIGSHARNGGD